MPVRERLLQHKRRYRGRGEEVQAAKAAIERETLADAGAIIERLRSAEALKQVCPSIIFFICRLSMLSTSPLVLSSLSNFLLLQ